MTCASLVSLRPGLSFCIFFFLADSYLKWFCILATVSTTEITIDGQTYVLNVYLEFVGVYLGIV